MKTTFLAHNIAERYINKYNNKFSNVAYINFLDQDARNSEKRLYCDS